MVRQRRGGWRSPAWRPSPASGAQRHTHTLNRKHRAENAELYPCRGIRPHIFVRDLSAAASGEHCVADGAPCSAFTEPCCRRDESGGAVYGGTRTLHAAAS